MRGEFASLTRPRLWLVWCLVAVATFGVHLVTLRISPPIWQDEVQIVDFGRTEWPGVDESYAMSWLLEGRPFKMVCLLGGLTQEMACRVAGLDAAGPRISATLGAILASMAMLGWLLARGTVPWIALVCSVLLLWEPAFVQSYRGARVDSWAIALMLCALWLIRGGGKETLKSGNAEKLKEATADGRLQLGDGPVREADLPTSNFDLQTYALAGILVALSGLMWVSAIILVPLLVLELVERGRCGGKFSLASALRNILWVSVFALVAVAVCLLPVWTTLPVVLEDFLAKSPSSGMHNGVLSGATRLMWAFGSNFWLPVFGVLALFWLRRWGLILAFALAVGLVLLTGPYIHRGIYLIPYMLLAVATAGTDVWQREARPIWHRLMQIAFGGMLLWSGAVSLGARSFTAWQQRHERDPEHLDVLAAREVGRGSYRVYTDPWELYYAGRKQGWRQFRSFFWHDMKEARFRGLLQTMDFVIFDATNPRIPSEQEMSALGFDVRKVSASDAGMSSAAVSQWLGRGYKDYVIYFRK